jgi:hypothetical protein
MPIYRVVLRTVTLVNEVFQSLLPGMYFSISSGNETLLPLIRCAVSRDGWPKAFNTTVSLDLRSGWHSEFRLLLRQRQLASPDEYYYDKLFLGVNLPLAVPSCVRPDR